jgi:hypothetical protein
MRDLFFGGGTNPGKCYDGGGHDKTSSSVYVLPFDKG